MMYYYIIAFLIIMVLYSFYQQEIDYTYNKLTRSSGNGYFSNIKNYYGYHMI